MPDLDLLATFLDIYRSGSVSRAAALRGISQPAASGQLARLEVNLGETLFERSARGAQPTEAAHDLARRTGPHLDAIRRALEETPGALPALGTVRLGGASDVLAVRVIPALAPMTAHGLRLRISVGLAADLLSALAQDNLDIVVSAVRPANRTLTATALIDEEFLLVGPPALAATVDPARLSADPVRALAHLPLVAYAEELPIIRRYWRSEFGRRAPNHVSITVPDLRAVLAAVIAGAGVSVLPRYLAEPAIASGSVLQLHEPQVAPLNTLYLVTRVSGQQDASVAAVRRHLLDRARSWGAL
jgi:DNA-binding transcriptional LysR family regulator